mmetsp:Transcript_22695/g.37513  ORF Transcript_22695/g.37513 Transcript_22695/m.37513 type:complete len:558 (+) Transcript_22695:118-1791(+)|eukprot:CAMPEP_0119319512 /NCGR_PEP_ID=MMETSP1333-20130426/49585_1 /TAXON_ID=418940 /ORGANISM="Scyphosphaera apsteinii, Strain RCC1455" /LENGTH=557 /DNA_ID=CAMNT_0007325935 /DNA_START=118 /DNA_END=1791 /DNA_ORIENTATION=-
MGKKQHSKDQLYITQTEWKADWGGAKSNTLVPYKVLPFDCCAISFRPFSGSPMCTADGIVFDLLNIVPYLKKYRRHPVTGGPLAASDLIKLQFHKNPEGKYHCPVLFKIFNHHTHIVAIKTSGNVYSYDAVKELNLKTGSLRDLIDDTPFARSDVITIQDPSDGSQREIERFAHVTQKLSAKADKTDETVRHNDATSRILSQLPGSKKAAVSTSATSSSTAAGGPGGPSASSTTAQKKQPEADAMGQTFAKPAAPRWLQTTGQHAASFTSTSVTPVTVNEIAPLSDEEEARQRYAFLKTLKKKAYAQMQTSHGNLNLELHLDITPMTCENFIGLCERGYYNGIRFHRLLRNFMVQGGDPTGTGKGGESMWGNTFKDETSSKLKHSGRGILSMANSGPNSNGSQFFITFKSCAHLDGKHSIFGRVVGGFDTLTKIESVPVDGDERPTQDVSITGVNVFVNPLEGLAEQMAKAHARASNPEAAKAEDDAKRQLEDGQAWYNTPVAQPQAVREGIGKYIAAQHLSARLSAPANSSAAVLEDAPPTKKAKNSARGFDFSNW